MSRASAIPVERSSPELAGSSACIPGFHGDSSARGPAAERARGCSAPLPQLQRSATSPALRAPRAAVPGGAGAAQPCSLPRAGARPSASLAISSRGGGIPPPIPFSASASGAAAPWWSCSPRPRTGSWWLCRRSAPRSWMQLFLKKKVKYFSLRLLAVLAIFLVLLFFRSVNCIFMCG